MTHSEKLIEAITSALNHAFWNGVSAGHDMISRFERDALQVEAQAEGLKEILAFVKLDQH